MRVGKKTNIIVFPEIASVVNLTLSVLLAVDSEYLSLSTGRLEVEGEAEATALDETVLPTE